MGGNGCNNTCCKSYVPFSYDTVCWHLGIRIYKHQDASHDHKYLLGQIISRSGLVFGKYFITGVHVSPLRYQKLSMLG